MDDGGREEVEVKRREKRFLKDLHHWERND